MTFYNTINIKSEDLKEAENKTETQSRIILNYFKATPATPYEVWVDLFDIETPLTSVG